MLLSFVLSLYAIPRKSQALHRKFTSLTVSHCWAQPLRHACGVPPPLPRGGFGSPRKVNGFARGSPTRGAGEELATRLRGCTKTEPFLCRKVRLLASPVSFWRKEWYNGFAVHPAYLTGEEVDALAYFLTFLVSVGADVVSHFICKWLDRCEENRKA